MLYLLTEASGQQHHRPWFTAIVEAVGNTFWLKEMVRVKVGGMTAWRPAPGPAVMHATWLRVQDSRHTLAVSFRKRHTAPLTKTASQTMALTNDQRSKLSPISGA